MIKFFLTFFLHLFYGTVLFCYPFPSIHASEEVTISLFNDFSVETYVFTPLAGQYMLFLDDNEPVPIRNNSIFYVTHQGSAIHIREIGREWGSYKNASFRSNNNEGLFQLKPVFPPLVARQYAGNIDFFYSLNRIQANNVITLNTYLGGVVLTEAGPGAKEEFYKAQSVLCRTYAFDNLNRHIEEGFHLCDGVHCQAFKGISGVPLINESVKATENIVVYDALDNLITAAFHSNCGGQSQNSEDVWVSSVPYLRSVKDPYCLHKRNATWKKLIPLTEWEAYFLKNGLTKPYQTSDFNFTQFVRKENYQVNDFFFPLNRIRYDLHLKSSFFSAKVQGNSILLSGKGYGHGVGMCQEGGMSMAEKGKNFREILEFYFSGIQIKEFAPFP